MAEKIFVASDASFEDAMAFLEEQMDLAELPMKVSMQVSVAFEEMYVNVCHYAYPNEDGTVLVRIVAEDGVLKITLDDTGLPYDPLKKEDPDITLSAEERNIGGLGIFIVRKTMDDMQYEYKDGHNILTILKKYE